LTTRRQMAKSRIEPRTPARPTSPPRTDGRPRQSSRSRRRSHIAISDRSITFGKSTQVKAHLRGGSTNRVVSIYSQPAGGHKQLLKKGAVNGDGNLVLRTRPSRTASYLATYAGGRWGVGPWE
jgi:hypothetical protein